MIYHDYNLQVSSEGNYQVLDGANGGIQMGSSRLDRSEVTNLPSVSLPRCAINTGIILDF